MTPEEKKIKRLEKQIQSLKEELREVRLVLEKKEYSLKQERYWRMDFQKLMKSVTQEDDLQDYDNDYRYRY